MFVGLGLRLESEGEGEGARERERERESGVVYNIPRAMGWRGGVVGSGVGVKGMYLVGEV